MRPRVIGLRPGAGEVATAPLCERVAGRNRRDGSGLAQFLSAWDEFSVEAEEYRELDEERVLVLVRKSGRGKTSGVELEQMPPRQAHLLHIRDGKVTRQVFYFERERALADLGLA